MPQNNAAPRRRRSRWAMVLALMGTIAVVVIAVGFRPLPAGEGWRVVVAVEEPPPLRPSGMWIQGSAASMAYSQAAWDSFWATIEEVQSRDRHDLVRLPAQPVIDFDREIVLLLEHKSPRMCGTRLDRVKIDREQRLIKFDTSQARDRPCGLMLGHPALHIIALSRSFLGPDVYTLDPGPLRECWARDEPDCRNLLEVDARRTE